MKNFEKVLSFGVEKKKVKVNGAACTRTGRDRTGRAPAGLRKQVKGGVCPSLSRWPSKRGAAVRDPMAPAANQGMWSAHTLDETSSTASNANSCKTTQVASTSLHANM